jgi:hypothetical protein
MAEAAVNTWLKHWLARQAKGKRALVLTDPSIKPGSAKISRSVKGKGKRPVEWVDPSDDDDGSGDAEVDDKEVVDDDAGEGEGAAFTRDSSNASADAENGSDNSPDGLSVPGNFAETRKSRHEFLMTLSEDLQYRRLLSLLPLAKVIFNITLHIHLILTRP